MIRDGSTALSRRINSVRAFCVEFCGKTVSKAALRAAPINTAIETRYSHRSTAMGAASGP